MAGRLEKIPFVPADGTGVDGLKGVGRKPASLKRRGDLVVEQVHGVGQLLAGAFLPLYQTGPDAAQHQRVTGVEQLPQTGAAFTGFVHPLLVQAQVVLPALHIVLLQLKNDLIPVHSFFASSISA